jgi:hypothetical protein
VSAQSKVTGTVRDTTANADVKNAVVLLLQPGDSVLAAFTRTDSKGNFELPAEDKDYILMVLHPKFADYVDKVNPKTAQPGTLALTSKSKLLEAVIVRSGSPIRIKGDTTIYTADSFQVSANANVEELLRKLPGIQVDKNGQIQAMGQTVEKVLVDGEEFFGDDPGMAVKNLRADAVKEVQVFDKKSEQAEFTGIDDGNTQKTINLKLKDDKKKGYFGKASVSGGLQNDKDDRYNNNLMFSSFKGKRKIAGFLLTGNTGQDGLNWQDNEKYGGGNDNYSMTIDEELGNIMYMSNGGSADDEVYVNPENGFLRNINAGVQYTNKWDNSKTFNFSPKYNDQIYDNRKFNLRQTTVGDSVLNEEANSVSHISRYNIKTTGSFDMVIDSNNTLKVTVRGNFYHTDSEEDRFAATTGNNGNVKNRSIRSTASTMDKHAISGNVIFKHKFKKLRRTLSFNADVRTLESDGDYFLESENEAYFGAGSFLQVFNQLSNSRKLTNTLSAKAVYTEPLTKVYALEIAHEVTYNSGYNDQSTYSYSPVSEKYDLVVDSLTNNFNQKIMVNKPSLKISYNTKKVKFNFGSGFGLTNFNLEDLTYDKNYIRNFTNFFPSASLNYTYKSNHNLRFTYNGNTTQPTINQLQPLRNNNDYFNQYIGNPDLKPSFSHNFNFSQNGYDFLKDRWMYQSLNVRLTSNSITNNRIINLDSAKTTTQPINTNGNVSVNLWSGVGFKIKKINTRLHINPNVGYSRFADVINSKVSFARNLNAGLSVNLQKSKDKKYELSLSNDFDHSSNKTTQNNTRTHFNSNTIAFDGTLYIKKVWSISTDFSYFTRQKIREFDEDINNKLWNARFQRTFRKNEFTAFIMVRDILNENIGITRSFYSNTFTEERNDRLRRYWMVGFSWDFKNKAPKAK